MNVFPTAYSEILQRIESIQPIQYGKSRNYLNGAVTRLSPYVSRGVISTRQIARSVLKRGFEPHSIESFLKELAWRDYFQQVWIAKGEDIDTDLKQPQSEVAHHKISVAVAEGKTGIQAIDQGITELLSTGYMHNHLRMYVASIACNIGKNHWKMPAQWMYYHLLDADWASNALSWQWVAGSFSSKKYYANQENINKYCGTSQQHTFLDMAYESFGHTEIPEVLRYPTDFQGTTILPEKKIPSIDPERPTYLYNFYNLDSNWDRQVRANRILLLEPGFFKRYPVSPGTMAFVLGLAQNIPDIQIFTGEFGEIFQNLKGSEIHYKEHPTNRHYQGIEHSRDWMFKAVKGYFPSFFSYWKRCEKHLHELLHE